MQLSSEFVILIVLVALIGALTTVIILPWIIKARERMKIHETLRYFMDKGQALSNEVLAALTDPPRPQPAGQRDLRAGILWLSLAVGIAGLVASIISMSDPGDVSWVMAPGLAAFPAAIGLGYVLLWVLNRHKQP